VAVKSATFVRNFHLQHRKSPHKPGHIVFPASSDWRTFRISVGVIATRKTRSLFYISCFRLGFLSAKSFLSNRAGFHSSWPAKSPRKLMSGQAKHLNRLTRHSLQPWSLGLCRLRVLATRRGISHAMVITEPSMIMHPLFALIARSIPGSLDFGGISYA
jgi:hypothetical protein